MIRSAASFVFALAVSGMTLLHGPAFAGAQEVPDSDCDLVSYRVLASQEPVPGQRVTRVGRPDVVCEDGTRLRADSAVIYQETARYELLGNVRYESPERELLAAVADYFESEERLFARGAVELRDRVAGSEVRGDTLILLMAGALREEDDLTVWGDRASAILPPDEEPPPPDADVDPVPPYRVVAGWMRFEGERFLRADGDVEVEREGMRAFSDSLTFDRTSGELTLVGEARLEAEDGTFSGRRIFVLLPDEELRAITVEERGRLVTDDLEVLGEEIRVTFEEERIQRLVAVDRRRAVAGEGEPLEEGAGIVPDLPDIDAELSDTVPELAEIAAEPPRYTEGRPPRPQAITEEFFLTGDSVDVRSPDEVLETIHAVGFAWGETRTAGAVIPDPWIRPSERPLGEGEGVGALDRDWIEGDTIVATFLPAPRGEVPIDVDPAADSEGGEEYVLDRLVATGSAGALHRSPPEERERDAPEPTPEERSRWAVSYVLADEIAVTLVDGRMDRVEAEGNLRGVQLDPLEPNDTDEDPAEEAPSDAEDPS